MESIMLNSVTGLLGIYYRYARILYRITYYKSCLIVDVVFVSLDPELRGNRYHDD